MRAMFRLSTPARLALTCPYAEARGTSPGARAPDCPALREEVAGQRNACAIPFPGPVPRHGRFVEKNI